MRNTLIASLLLLISPLSILTLQAKPPQTTPSLVVGTYTLQGSNPDSSTIDYKGEVDISSHGSNYMLAWRIGNSQIQTGIGILKDRVLSVAYFDHNGQGAGVVSFYLTDAGKLEGTWAGYGSSLCGKESLILKANPR